MTKSQLKIAELKRLLDSRTALLNFSKAITEKANTFIAVEDILKFSIKEICHFSTYPVSHLSIYDKKNEELVSSKLRYLTTTHQFLNFSNTKKSNVVPSKLARSACKKRISIAQNNVKEGDTTFSFALAIPIVIKNKLYAILEFFSNEPVSQKKENLDNLVYIQSNIEKAIDYLFCKQASEQHVSHQTISKAGIDLCWKGAGYGMWEWDIKTDNVILSDGWKKSLGYEPHEIKNDYDEWDSRIHPEDKEVTLRNLNEHFKTKIPYKTEYRMKVKTGEWRWFQSIGQTLWGKDNTPIHMAGSIRDIHDYKITQRDLEESKKLAEESKAHLELSWKGAGDGMWNWNVKTNEVILSDRWKHQLGYAIYEIRNHFDEWESRIHPKDKEAVLKALFGHLNKKNPYKHEYRMKMKNGKWHWFQDRGQAIWDKNGEALRMAGSLRDIHERKTAQKELEKSKKLADAANEAKSRFLANMSHEIRTPMNGIMGMTSLLLGSGLNKQQQEYVNLILNSSENMMQIINDILDLSKIEAGKIELEYSEFDFKKESSEVINLIKLSAQEKGLKLLMNYHDDLPKFVIGDYGRIRQILLNLINNAVKFAQEGEIKVNFEVEKESKDNVYFKISVIDEGVGIAEDKIESIFNKFNQVDVSTTRKYGGTGLGLPICQELATLMGGSIGAKSIENKGSTFWLSIKLKKASKAFITHVKKEPSDTKNDHLTFTNTNILLVEDNPVNQKFMMHTLKKYHFHVTPAADGQEAVAQYRKQKFDIILMDCHMPIMDGYEATGMIRELEKKNKNPKTPIVAITANALKTDREKCLKAGMDDYISKPFTKKTLEIMLLKWIDKAKQA